MESERNRAKNIAFLNLHVDSLLMSSQACVWMCACHKILSLTVDLADPSARINYTTYYINNFIPRSLTFATPVNFISTIRFYGHTLVLYITLYCSTYETLNSNYHTHWPQCPILPWHPSALMPESLLYLNWSPHFIFNLLALFIY